MILPASTLASLLLLVLTLVCWGSWANSQRLVFKWRFELFYYDFALGMAACILIATFTLGGMNSQELSVSDNFMIASYRKMAFAVAALRGDGNSIIDNAEAASVSFPEFWNILESIRK